ncbi:hypothetical protein FE257_005315 [Aspergillus nanangensis]|uniref:Uncharacterized protein n=1 Tax=Aspergillus nanangensis TaxID=2582783 RepID=A0AAD4CAC4_ASPNN|nr:hypothetical protein FE257_005315 [Aspergillus nanangensis]
MSTVGVLFPRPVPQAPDDMMNDATAAYVNGMAIERVAKRFGYCRRGSWPLPTRLLKYQSRFRLTFSISKCSRPVSNPNSATGVSSHMNLNALAPALCLARHSSELRFW